MLIATGLDPERSTIFAQSHVHGARGGELAAVVGDELRRAATHDAVQGEVRRRRSSSRPGSSRIPCCRPATSSSTRPTSSRSAIDQRQHIELTRDVAERFNSRYGETFTLPRGVYPGGSARKIMDLQEPEQEDVDDGRNRAGHVRTSSTAGRDPAQVQDRRHRLGPRGRPRPRTRPGISNLIEIMTVATGESIAEVESRYDGAGLRDVQGGRRRGRRRARSSRSRRASASSRDDAGELQRLLALGAEKAREASRPTLEAMYERMGFVEAGLEADAEPQRRDLASPSARATRRARARRGRAPRTATRCRCRTGWPTASHIRLTWCFRPSCSVSSRRLSRVPRRRRARSAGAVDPSSSSIPSRSLARSSARRRALDVGLVDLRDAVARMRESVREIAVVRQQERAGRVDVEPPDRDDARLGGNEVDDGPPSVRVARRRDDAGRLVQEHVRERLRLDALRRPPRRRRAAPRRCSARPARRSRAPAPRG